MKERNCRISNEVWSDGKDLALLTLRKLEQLLSFLHPKVISKQMIFM